jgi:hypothetical protein
MSSYSWGRQAYDSCGYGLGLVIHMTLTRCVVKADRDDELILGDVMICLVFELYEMR